MDIDILFVLYFQEAADLGKKVCCLDFVKPSPQGTTWGESVNAFISDVHSIILYGDFRAVFLIVFEIFALFSQHKKGKIMAR